MAMITPSLPPLCYIVTEFESDLMYLEANKLSRKGLSNILSIISSLFIENKDTRSSPIEILYKGHIFAGFISLYCT